MDNELTMSATFTASPEALEKLLGTGDEYIVKAPWERVRWCFKDGTVKERKQDIRERVTRCRDCKHAYPRGGELDCSHFSQWDYYSDEPGHWPIEPDGFCAWGERGET